MRWETRRRPYDDQWRPWFAWYPVQVGKSREDCYYQSRWAWLERVEYKMHCGYGDCSAEYRLPQLPAGKECGR